MLRKKKANKTDINSLGLVLFVYILEGGNRKRKGKEQQKNLSCIFITLKIQTNSAWKLENTIGTFSKFVSIIYTLLYLASSKKTPQH